MLDRFIHLTVKNKLYILGIFSFVTATFIYLMLFESSRRMHIMNDISQLTSNIEETVLEINFLTHMYLQHFDERPKIQWALQHQKLAKLLDVAQARQPQAQRLVETLRRHHGDLGRLFRHIVANPETSGTDTARMAIVAARRARIVEQMFVHSRRMATAARRLATESRAELLVKQQHIQRLVLVASSVLLALLAVASWLLGTNMSRALTHLREGADIVAAGHLDHTVQVKSQDEIGQLAWLSMP